MSIIHKKYKQQRPHKTRQITRMNKSKVCNHGLLQVIGLRVLKKAKEMHKNRYRTTRGSGFSQLGSPRAAKMLKDDKMTAFDGTRTTDRWISLIEEHVLNKKA